MSLVGVAVALTVMPGEAALSPTVNASALAADLADSTQDPAGGAASISAGGPLAPIFGALGPEIPAFSVRAPDPADTDLWQLTSSAQPPATLASVAGDIPSTALDAYRRAATAAPAGCGLDWSLLAAVGRVESNHGRYAGATLQVDGRSTPPVLGPRLNGTITAWIPDTDDGGPPKAQKQARGLRLMRHRCARERRVTRAGSLNRARRRSR